MRSQWYVEDLELSLAMACSFEGVITSGLLDFRIIVYALGCSEGIFLDFIEET